MRFSLALRTLSLLAIMALSDSQSNQGDDNVPVRLVFKYKNQQGKAEAAALGRLNTDISGLNIASISTTRGNWRAIEANPNIESVDIDHEVHVIGEALDTPSLRGHRQLAETTPYGITMVQANDPGLPTIPVSNPKMKICIVDTGYDLGHVDLPFSNINGYVPSDELYVGQKWDVDGHSHGTHVAGTIGAIGGNGIGVNSIMSDPDKFYFFIGKGVTDSGSGYTSTVLEAVQACAANGAKVVNLSLGGTYSSTTERDAYRAIFNQGVLLVAAAGNSGDSTFNYPASYPDLMSVASVDSNEGRSGYSTYNNQVEIAAPGSSVYSTVPDDLYSYKSGTSMASPHVAGVAALVWSYFPQCSNVQIRNVLVQTAKDKGTTGCDVQYGAGIVQAKAAYDLLLAKGCEAGGITPATKSDGSFGGCGQHAILSPECTLAAVGESCTDGSNCCSGLCSGGKPGTRTCLSSDGGSGTPPPPPPGTCSALGESCVESVDCCAGLLCSTGKKGSRTCYPDPNA